MHESQHPLSTDFTLNNDKKQSHRKHRRGSRPNRKRASSYVGEEVSNNDDFIVVNRRKSTGGKHHYHRQEEESPAFQSLQDIISEMKRLPSISVTSPNNDFRRTSTDASRGRRFSEPFHTTGDSKYHDNLQPIDEYLDEKDEKACFVSQDQLTPTHQKRTRSQSVPDTLTVQQERKPLYPVHLNDTDALAQVRGHKLFSGILRVDWQDSSDANVECEELDNIYIYGSRNRNRAIDGDEVALELVDVDTMLKEKQAKKQARHTRRMSSSLSSIPEDPAVMAKPKYCGKVVCILERPRNMLFSGTLSLQRPHAKNLDNSSREKKTTNPKIIWFIPADKRLPLVAVPIKHAPTGFVEHHGEYHNRIFVGNITRWPVTSLHPFGTIEKEIGWMGELDVHLGALMADHHLKDDEFTDGLIKACNSVPIINDAHNRRDLCDLDVFTIGQDDFDTGHAFSINYPEKDVIEVGIHVPDVIKFIKTGNALDREARERICAVKLVNKKIPILPSAFIESHFSLKPNKERSSYSVMCRFTENGVLLHAWIGATIIKSKKHIHFKQKKESDLKNLLDLCQKLQNNRIQNSLSLVKSNLEFDFGPNGYTTSIHRVDEMNDDTRVLLQEILIIANLEVGQKISSRFPDQALLMRQEEPKMSKLELVQDYFENNQNTGSIYGLLKLANAEVDEEKKQSLLHFISKSITPPKFFSAGSVDISKYSYFSHGTPIYALFTEPTQHYASIMVQRQLQAVLKGEEQENESFDVIDKIARHCNGVGLSIRTAEQESRTLYTAAYIYQLCLENQPLVLRAYVLGIHTETTILIYIPEFDLEMPLILNEMSLPGHPRNHCDYDHALHKMKVIWYNNDQETVQVLEFLSVVDVCIGADMKVVKPVLLVELLHPNV